MRVKQFEPKSFFNNRAKKYGKNIKTLDWGSERTQRLRFEALMQVGELQQSSILDVGCGFCDLYQYLLRSGIDAQYSGVDISDEIVSLSQPASTDFDLKVHDMFEKPDPREFDYVIASGIHYLKCDDNYQRMLTILNNMFCSARVGVATNFIRASHKLEVDEHVFTYDIDKVIAICEQITPYWSIRTDYLDHDATIYLYKKELSKR